MEDNEDSLAMSDIITRRKQTDARIKQRKIDLKKAKDAKMRQFLEMEADIGSNDEDHDECAPKMINADDAEEDEEGQDGDLKGFVVNEADIKGEQGDDGQMMQKFIDDRNQDDKNETAKIYQSIFLGQNRKRKRGDIDCDSQDEAMKKKLKRIEDRLGEDSDSLENGMLKRQKITPNQLGSDDEEMSDREV